MAGFDIYGTFSRVHNWVADRNANIRIIASRMDEEFNNFAAGLTNTITRDGYGKPNVDISWNNKRITNLADPNDLQDAATKKYAEDYSKSTTRLFATTRNYQAIHADFGFLPFKAANIVGNGQVVLDETISHAAIRTEVCDDPYAGEAVYVTPWGNDTAGTGSRTAPYRQVSKALTAKTNSLIRVFCNVDGTPGKYGPISLRSDTNAAGCVKLRIVEAIGPIDFEYTGTIDISVDNRATASHGIASGYVVTDGDTVTVNGEVYTFKNAPTAYNHIAIVGGESRQHWSERIAAAVNQYSPYVTAIYSGLLGGLTTVTFTARTPGIAGNTLTLATASVNPIFSVSAATLSGGGPGWVAEGSGVYYRDLNPALEAPRGVFFNKLPTGEGVSALSYYGNRITATFSAQPTAGDTITVNSGYLGTARTITFTAGGAVSITTCPIGATLADTLANLLACVNGNAFFFGLTADTNNTVVRFTQRMGSNPALNITEASAAITLSALILAKDTLIGLDNADPAYNTTFRNMSLGGWAYDAATGRLRVKIIGGADVTSSLSSLSMVSGASSNATRNFVSGGRILFKGDIQFRNTYLYGALSADPVTYPTRIWVDLTNKSDRPAGLFSPLDVGSLEAVGTQSIIGNAVFNNTFIDAYHPTSHAKTAVVGGGSYYAGDPFTFSQMEFPNRNGFSPHGVNSVSVILGGTYANAVGPLITGEGKIIIAGTIGRNSVGLSNQYGYLSLANSTAYLDTCIMQDNNSADYAYGGGATSVYIAKGRYTTGVGTVWQPPFVG